MNVDYNTPVKRGFLLIFLIFTGISGSAIEVHSQDTAPIYPPASTPPGVEVPYPSRPGFPPMGPWGSPIEPKSPEQEFREHVASLGKIVIDPGHGGYSPGLQGEKEFTLAFAEKLASLYVAEGVEVIVTRTTNRYVSLTDRLDKIRQGEPNFFISVHMARERFFVHGVTSRGAVKESRAIRDRLIEGLKQTFGRGRVDDRELPLFLAREVDVPGIILEIPSDMASADDATLAKLFKLVTYSFRSDDRRPSRAFR